METSREMGAIVGTTLKRFLADKPGATAIKFCLIAAGISVAIIAIVQVLGSTLRAYYA